ncbi:Activator of basal transcription 1 [Trachymyrmex zeteki]|uniref:Activator of basal transcription 1 n=1 Tax=Mycetomoellerius zeteki TaxID=64791 RepID=A0A151WXA0_9HYME|nr:PREDICTED: activator of basal transcription 1-like [Trachymyrmex zeteki]KYQ52291.1 Activator of basal transcription 1 [Trachymyrmex zeteki]
MVLENLNESNEDNHTMDCDADESTQIQKKIIEKKGKKIKRGIIYLSTIPKYMNVTMIQEMFSAYGKIGRVYLQLVDNETQSVKHKKKTKKIIKYFTEGWVEFESKKVAKFVAETLNNTKVSTRKKSKFYDIMWNIKYLPRFKWVHLSERLAYERAVHKQRLLTEIAQAKREINFFSYNVDRSKKLRRKHEQGEKTTFELPEVKQRDTDNEIRNRKANTQVEDRTEFLKSIFG